jgi:hypothetical protein
MRFTSRILFGTFIALCWTGLAHADPSDTDQGLDPSVLRAVMNMQLDSAFEGVITQSNRQAINGLAGPSSMDCTNSVVATSIETCVVTAVHAVTEVNAMPAALAQH